MGIDIPPLSEADNFVPSPSPEPILADEGNEIASAMQEMPDLASMDGLSESPEIAPLDSALPVESLAVAPELAVVEAGQDIMQGMADGMGDALIPPGDEQPSFLEGENASLVSPDSIPTDEAVSAAIMQGDLPVDFPDADSMPIVNEDLSTSIEKIAETTVIGTPTLDAIGYHEQEYGQPTCVQASVEGIINKHQPGSPVTEEKLKTEAIRDGVYNTGKGGGTLRSYIKESLIKHGVPAEERYGASLLDIQQALEQKQDVIITCDPGILWNDSGCLNQGHAVRVTGLAIGADGAYEHVFLRDSGNPDIDGQGQIPVGQFLDAWRKSGNFMVKTLKSAWEAL